ncbi:MAG: hypothetical protein HZB38_02510 [Planctomycetes bacterium]|nr:hypothetical protein [Planctomycetota bacterium]
MNALGAAFGSSRGRIELLSARNGTESQIATTLIQLRRFRLVDRNKTVQHPTFTLGVSDADD